MRHQYVTVLATYWLAACGQPAATPAASQGGQTTSTPSAPAPASQEQELAVTVVRELGWCDMQTNGRVVYVLPTQTFKVCDGTTGSWYDVDLKGSKGDPGDKGDSVKGDPGEVGQAGRDGADGESILGATGAAGRDGADGVSIVGAPGQDGVDGRSVTAAEWHDPITGDWWTLSSREVSWGHATGVCVGDYRVPTADEWRLATMRGICNVGNPCVIAWTAGGVRLNIDAIDPGDGRTVAAVLCIDAA